MNCAGGLTGGDRFEVTAEAGPATRLTLTTQAAERAYRAAGDAPARLSTHLQIREGARLNWLPQETILFDGCHLARRLEIDMAADARFLMVEPLLFGRTAMGEYLRAARFTDDVRLRREGMLVHGDATRMAGDIEAQLRSGAVTGGGRAVASVLYAGPDAEALLDRAREIIGSAGGASLKADGLLVMRLIAKDALHLRRTAIPLIAALSGEDIPKTWTL